VFEAGVGKGRLFVSAMNHSVLTSDAGLGLLSTFVGHVAEGPPPKRALKPETIRRMREKLREKKIDLTKETWRFKPDPKNVGVTENWHRIDLKLDESWSTIRVGKHWEAQGWPQLDGWAWYRLETTIPKDWTGQPIYLSFEGVDDHYEAFVNGTKVGAGGDPLTKRTAFDEPASHRITHVVKPGEKCVIAVRVLDWYGAGGIHRPVSIGTAEIGAEGNVLR
jgi:beta-galactosidase/beta-glucuronidase